MYYPLWRDYLQLIKNGYKLENMCGEVNMIECTLLITTAVATFFAAIAAWFSFRVSKNSLEFQKKYAKNQNLTLLIVRLNLTDSKVGFSII